MEALKKAPPRRWTPEHTAQLKGLHEAGLGRNAVAMQMGFSLETVTRWAKKSGLTWEQVGKVAKAVESLRVDNKARRISIVQRAYSLSEGILDDMEKVRAGQIKHKTIINTGMGAQGEIELDFIPPTDVRFLSQALSALLTSASTLEKIDQDGGLEQARGMVSSIIAAIRSSVEDVPRMNATQPGVAE